MRLVCLVLIAGCCLAQTDAKRPPTREEVATQLLTAVRDGVGAADPVLQPFLLWRAADTWIALDKAKAAKYLDEAFDRASVIPPGLPLEPKSSLQCLIAGSMLSLDIDKAAEMLKRVYVNNAANAYDPRGPLVSKIVSELIAKGRMDDAVEMQSNTRSLDGLYQLMTRLPEDDPRRIILFGNAISAWQTRPDSGFGKLVAAQWKTLPKNQVVTALDSIVSHLSKYDDAQNDFQISYTTAQGVANLPTRADTELFDIVVPLRELEPKKLEEILATRKELARTLEMMPNGFERDKVQGASMGPAKGVQNSGPFLNATLITARALEALKTSPQQAFQLAKTIPGGQMRAGCYIQIAGALLQTDEASARRAISLAMESLKEAGDDEINGATQSWRNIIQFATDRLKDDELAREALNGSFTSLRAMYKIDANPDDPNVVPIENWPSSSAYRAMMAGAVKIYGTGATTFIEKAPDANMVLVCQAALAAELMGRKQQSSTSSMHLKRDKK